MESLFEKIEVKSSPPKRVGILALPFIIISSLIGLFLWVGIGSLTPVMAVDVSKVRLAQGKILLVQKKEGTVFQAAGWIEADPFSIRVTALVSGVIKNVHVVSGQKVRKGQLLADLIDEDLQLQLRKTQAHLKALQAELETKKAKIIIQKAHREKLSSERNTQKMALKRLEHKANSLRLSKIGIPKLEIEQANFSAYEQKFKIREYISREKIIATETQLIKKEIAVVREQIKIQQIESDRIELDIRRLRIIAPTDGVIQRLYVRKGRKQILSSDNEMSTTIAKIYDPKHLQVRVDVPLADIAKVSVGQKTIISVEASSKPLTGVVTILSGEADYQKNTLEVKVRIEDPLAILRPEMLAQVKFLQNEKMQQKMVSHSLLVRKDAVHGDVNNLYAWVVSLQNRLQQRKIECIGERKGWLAVINGLQVGERVVVSEESRLKIDRKVQIRRLYE